jgi:hypothetical protein
MSCLTPEDLLAYKYRCATVEICCDDESIQAALDAAQEKVEAYTGQKFCPEEGCKWFDGNGKSVLFLTDITSLPLSDLESITITEWGKEDIEVSLDEIHHEPHTLGYKSNNCWPCGRRNIKVCGTYGIDIPDGVESVILTLALESIQPGSAGLQHNSVMSAKWNDFSIQYKVDKTFDYLTKTTGSLAGGVVLHVRSQ